MKRDMLERYRLVIDAILNRTELPLHLTQVSSATSNKGSTMFAAILHERSDQDPADINVRHPRHVFSLFVGETCLSIPVLDDTTVRHQIDRCTLNMKMSLQFPNGRLDYHKVKDFDWSSKEPTLSPFARWAITF